MRTMATKMKIKGGSTMKLMELYGTYASHSHEPFMRSYTEILFPNFVFFFLKEAVFSQIVLALSLSMEQGKEERGGEKGRGGKRKPRVSPKILLAPQGLPCHHQADFGALGPGQAASGQDAAVQPLEGLWAGRRPHRSLEGEEFLGALPTAHRGDQFIFPGTSSPGQWLSALGLCPGGRFEAPKRPRVAILLEFFKHLLARLNLASFTPSLYHFRKQTNWNRINGSSYTNGNPPYEQLSMW